MYHVLKTFPDTKSASLQKFTLLPLRSFARKRANLIHGTWYIGTWYMKGSMVHPTWFIDNVCIANFSNHKRVQG